MRLGLTTEQIAERRLGIGGTDAARIMAGDWPALWREKTGRAEPQDLSGILPVQLGSFTEPFNRFWFEKMTGRTVLMPGCHYTHPDHRHMVCNADGVTQTAAGMPAYWDAKHVGVVAEATILRYVPQMTHCATVTGCDWWIISFLIGNSRWQMVEEQVDSLYAEEMMAAEAEFWGYVTRDEEPPDMSAEAIAAPKIRPKLRTISLNDVDRDAWPNWGPQMVDSLGKFATTHAAFQAHEIAKREIRELMPEDVGTITRGRIKAARDKAGAVRIALSKKGDPE